MSTIQELLGKINKTKHQLAVWKELESHLAKFIDTDAGKATIGIVSMGSGGVVTQDVLLEEKVVVEEIRTDIETELIELETTQVTKDEPAAEETSSSDEKKKPAGKKGKGSSVKDGNDDGSTKN